MDAILETERLIVRRATAVDADMYYQLWTDSKVMTYVGFPQGLPLTRAEVAAGLATQPDGPLDARLVVTLREMGEAIGECSMHTPDAATGIAETDVKLLPAFWGRRYGVEVKRALVDYLFTHTDCTAVQATPNINNKASIKMQEAVGGVRVGEGVFTFPPEKQSYTTPVPHYVYHVRRADWEAQQTKD